MNRFKEYSIDLSRGGAEIGRQARLRILCPIGRVGSSPISRIKGISKEVPFFVINKDVLYFVIIFIPVL